MKVGLPKVEMIMVRETNFVGEGPTGRHEIATSVRAWLGRHPKILKALRADTSLCHIKLISAAPPVLN
jgi:hypothetical protein